MSKNLLYVIMAVVLGLIAIGTAMGADVELQCSQEFNCHREMSITLTGVEDATVFTKWWLRADDGQSPDPDLRVWQDLKGVSFWCPPGKYEVLVTVVIPPDGDNLPVDLVSMSQEFLVTSNFVPVDPPDDPDDPPPPPPPTNFSDIPAEIFRLGGPVRDDSKAETARIIAEAYRTTGADHLSYENQEVLADATSSQFIAEIGLNKYVRWRPMMSRIRELMVKLMKEERLEDKNMPQWGELWEAIAQGFDKIAKEEEDAASSGSVQPS